MSKFISTFIDPIGLGFGEALTGKKSGIVNVNPDGFGGKKDSGSGSSNPTAPSASEGILSDAEAQDIAKKKLFRSGTVATSPLGEDITASQLSGTQLQ